MDCQRHFQSTVQGGAVWDLLQSEAFTLEHLNVQMGEADHPESGTANRLGVDRVLMARYGPGILSNRGEQTKKIVWVTKVRFLTNT